MVSSKRNVSKFHACRAALNEKKAHCPKKAMFSMDLSQTFHQIPDRESGKSRSTLVSTHIILRK